MMYMDDANRATIELMQVDKAALSTFKSYNISAISFSPEEIAKEIRTQILILKLIIVLTLETILPSLAIVYKRSRGQKRLDGKRSLT